MNQSPHGNKPGCFLHPKERDAIRVLISFIRDGCPDGPLPDGFPINQIEDFRRVALEYFSDPPDPIHHFRIDVPSDDFVRTQAAVYWRPSGMQIELALTTDGESSDLTAVFDMDRQSTTFAGPKLYDLHVL